MANKEFIIASAIIAHSGVKGMKWGVNKYRNPDGTLTEAGKERYRYNKESTKNMSKMGQEVKDSIRSAREAVPETKNRPKPIRKDYSDIPNQELEKRIKRLELEHRYGDLTGDTKYVKSGSEKVTDILAIVGAAAAIGVSALTIRSLMYDNTIKKSDAINRANNPDYGKEKRKSK